MTELHEMWHCGVVGGRGQRERGVDSRREGCGDRASQAKWKSKENKEIRIGWQAASWATQVWRWSCKGEAKKLTTEGH